jgi:hypothetical protein
MQTRRLLDVVVPRLQASAGARLAARQRSGGDRGDRDGGPGGGGAGGSESETYLREANRDGASKTPFELEVLEGVLLVSTGAGG